MREFKLHMIAAVGKNGAIGLEGKLPWHKPDDLRIFKTLTTNALIIVGKRTADTLPNLPGRTIIKWSPKYGSPELLLENIMENEDVYEAWLCGGAYVYEKFAHLVNGNRIVNYIDYDGPFDTEFPFEAYGLVKSVS